MWSIKGEINMKLGKTTYTFSVTINTEQQEIQFHTIRARSQGKARKRIMAVVTKILRERGVVEVKKIGGSITW